MIMWCVVFNICFLLCDYVLISVSFIKLFYLHLIYKLRINVSICSTNK